MIEPGTNVPAGSNPPGPTPWMCTWWWTIRFSLYSPCGLADVGAFGHTTTSQKRRAVVGRAACSAACTVLYVLDGPTSASSGLLADVPGVDEPTALSTWMLSPLTLDNPAPFVMLSAAGPEAKLDGTVNTILVSDQLAVVTVVASS